MIARTMHDFLPIGMIGLFILLMIMAMISTDNSRIYSAALTVAQDVILPFYKKTADAHTAYYTYPVGIHRSGGYAAIVP